MDVCVYTLQALLAEAKRLVDEKARAAGMGGSIAEAKWADSKVAFPIRIAKTEWCLGSVMCGGSAWEARLSGRRPECPL